MAPRLAFDDMDRSHTSYAERSGNLSGLNTLSRERTDGAHGAVIQNRVRVSCTPLLNVRRFEHAAPLTDAVIHVVRLCPEKQVLGTNARRVVAAMEDMEADGNRSFGEFVRDSVGSATTFTIPHEEPVAAISTGALPDQAFADLFRSTPQSRRVVPNSHERMIPCR